MSKQFKEKILVVDDEELIRWTLSEALRKWGYVPLEAATVFAAQAALEADKPSAVFLDIHLPDGSGLELLREIKHRQPDTVVVVITADILVDNSVAALKGGAYDFIGKPINLGELEITIRNALEAQRLRREVRFARNERARQFGFEQIIGQSPAMRETVNLARKVAQSEVTSVLLQGASGTGKDLLAKAIHYASPRASAPFIAINCAALPVNLIESELFGYEKGAFTDAKARKEGLFEQAEGGTLFLDEIGELELGLQAKLLRVLEEGTFRRVGGLKDLPLNIRVIAASNRDLNTESEQGRFRVDLYYRLSVMQIDVPPLCDRGDDVLLLADYYLSALDTRAGNKVCYLSPETAAAFRRYSWPGNVRELRNVIERAILLEEGQMITTKYLPHGLTPEAVPAPACKSGVTPDVPNGHPHNLFPPGLTLDEIETSLVRQAVAQCGGNQTQAAEFLGISRDRVRTRLRKASKFGHRNIPNLLTVSPAGEDQAAHGLTEEALRMSRAQLAGIIESAMDGIITVDDKQRIVLINAAAEGIFRCKAAEAIGQPLDRFIPEKYRALHRQHVRDFGVTKETKRRIGALFPITGLRADGEEFPLEASVSQIELGGQKLYTVILRDISERVKSEDALRESEERFRLTFAQAGVGIVQATPDGEILQANPGFCRMLGYTAGELVGRSINDITHPEDLPAERERAERILSGKAEGDTVEKRYLRKDGETVWGRVTATAARDESGRVMFAVDIVEDITNRRSAEEKIEWQNALLDIAQDAILVRDEDDNILYWNKGAERLYGWASDEAVGKNAVSLLYRERPPQTAAAHRAILEKGEWRGELRQITKEGSEVVVESRWTLMRARGAQAGTILIVNTDVTEKKQLEAELQRAGQLSLIGEMAAGLAHEIKNPLAGIQGAVDILIARREPDDAECRILELIRREVGRVDTTVRDLLERARPHALELAPASLNEVVERAVTLAAHQHADRATNNGKKVGIGFEPAPVSLTLVMDAARVEDAVLNLIVNAVDAIAGEGRVTVRVRHVKGEAGEESPEEALVEVEDTGRGIAEADLEKIFNPFFTNKEHGTGLGLSAVSRIAHAHGGWAEVKSCLGIGSVFTLHLPLDVPRPSAPAESTRQSSSYSSSQMTATNF